MVLYVGADLALCVGRWGVCLVAPWVGRASGTGANGGGRFARGVGRVPGWACGRVGAGHGQGTPEDSPCALCGASSLALFTQTFFAVCCFRALL